MSCVDLPQSSVLLVLEQIEFAGLLDSLESLVDLGLFSVDDGRDLGELLVLNIGLALGLFHDELSALKSFS